MTLAVIGAGLGRTGTSSLKRALQILGVTPCYHMMDIKPCDPDISQWMNAANGKIHDWNVIFGAHCAAVDWPTCSFYRELMGFYPEAKVILTTRDEEEWFESTQSTIFETLMKERATLPEIDGGISHMAWNIIGEMFSGILNQREHCIRVYRAHNEEVRRTVPSYRLLDFNVAEGWRPLCDFLDVPIPKVPFPKANTSSQYQSFNKNALTT